MGAMPPQAKEHLGLPAAEETQATHLPQSLQGELALPTPARHTSASQKRDPQCMSFLAPELVVLFMATLGKKTDSCIRLDWPDDPGGIVS